MNHRRAPFVATCRTCDVHEEAESANETVEFYRRHYRQTGHDVVLTRTDLDFQVPGVTDLETVIADLETHYDGGVPIGVVAAAMNERGFSIGETLEEIHEVRMTGALYEPRNDHLAVF